MSTKPFNNLIVNDLTTPVPVQQPYVNSTTEVGYFSNPNGSSGILNATYWYSLNTTLKTNNGIASSSSGLKILNPGIYKLNLSVWPDPGTSGNLRFNFGTLFQNGNNLLNNDISAFGGSNAYYMHTFDNNINKNIPGIISWIANGYGYNSGSSPSAFSFNTSYQLSYIYYYSTTTAEGTQFISNGICTTEITFFVNQSNTIIYFNVNPSTSNVKMSNCYFTLQLMSTYNVPVSP